MKKVSVLIVLSLVLSGLGSPALAQPQYANYTTPGSGNSFPFNQPDGKLVQLLFGPGDFNLPSAAPAGSITTIWFLIKDQLGPWTYSDLTVRMGQSVITQFAPGAFYSPLTTVYYRASTALTGTAGQWMAITLDTPFAYNPAQSLIVEVSQTAAPGATGFSVYYTTVTNRRNYSVGGAPFAYAATGNNAYHAGLTVVPSVPAMGGSSYVLVGMVLAGGALILIRRPRTSSSSVQPGSRNTPVAAASRSENGLREPGPTPVPA